MPNRSKNAKPVNFMNRSATSKKNGKKHGSLMATIEFIQTYDKFFQIVAIILPTLAITYLWNEQQNTNKQIEIANLLKGSLLSEKKIEQQFGFGLLLSVSNDSLIRSIARVIPNKQRDELIGKIAIDAINDNDLSALRLVTKPLCLMMDPALNKIYDLDINGSKIYGSAIQFVRFPQPEKQKDSLLFDLLRCGADPLFGHPTNGDSTRTLNSAFVQAAVSGDSHSIASMYEWKSIFRKDFVDVALTQIEPHIEYIINAGHFFVIRNIAQSSYYNTRLCKIHLLEKIARIHPNKLNLAKNQGFEYLLYSITHGALTDCMFHISDEDFIKISEYIVSHNMHLWSP